MVLQVKAQVGESFGIGWGTGWKRDDQETLLSTKKTGLHETENNVRLGDIYPDFTMGINNRLPYKGFNPASWCDIRQGGSLYSGTFFFKVTRSLCGNSCGTLKINTIESGVITECGWN
ncbi:hypothetical protein [Parabacteroides goldsteinii]|uniref:hypothetical protein n=1 Tax=Parabacteroides goldsteinii TaxID=328812 RepID=UPI002165122F|nr:hypothetical protein [Parabacteroides goldsteinii]MCS2429331.1 hypothetical protein [Parabacteroides goldsteinii]